MSFQVSRRKAIATRGRTMTLNRIGGGGGNPLSTTSLSLIGTMAYYSPNDVAGDIRQGDAQVAITNDEILAANWSPPPRARDQMIIDGKTYSVQNAWAVYDAAVCIGHNIWLRGG